jgi:hypothetical protein
MPDGLIVEGRVSDVDELLRGPLGDIESGSDCVEIKEMLQDVVEYDISDPRSSWG